MVGRARARQGLGRDGKRGVTADDGDSFAGNNNNNNKKRKRSAAVRRPRSRLFYYYCRRELSRFSYARPRALVGSCVGVRGETYGPGGRLWPGGRTRRETTRNRISSAGPRARRRAADRRGAADGTTEVELN